MKLIEIRIDFVNSEIYAYFEFNHAPIKILTISGTSFDEIILNNNLKEKIAMASLSIDADWSSNNSIEDSVSIANTKLILT